jgi:tetratricopeptide (TPR) repeat protein
MRGPADELQNVLALQRQGKWTVALRRLEGLRKQAPRSAPIELALGRTLLALKRPEEAAATLRMAVRLDRSMAEGHFQLANALRLLERLPLAARSYERAVELAPSYAQGWYQLGAIRQLQDQSAGAEVAYRRTLAIDPRQAPAENNLGLVLQAQGRTDEAIAAFERAIRVDPKHVLALVNLGAVLQHRNRLQEAIAVLGRALQLEPRDPRALGNLGNALVALNRPAEAVAAYQRALAVDPGFQGNQYNVALARLVQGELGAGWAGYDSRLETADHRGKYPVGRPRWQPGMPVRGRSVLLYAEQGLGDTLQFVRYVPMVRELGAQVVLQVQTALKPLVARSLAGVTVIGSREAVPEHELQCSLLSLPRHFRTELDSIPAPISYLTPAAPKLAQWQAVFARAPGAKVGLVWAGNPKHQFDHNRSVPLAEFSRLTAEPRAHFFSLQKELKSTDRSALASWQGVTDLAPKLASWDDTAAVVGALDLVITVDTAVAHLAGALGRPAWVLLSFAPDWRWLLGRDRTPWYPTLRLFRQQHLGQWEPVIRQVRAELSAGGR